MSVISNLLILNSNNDLNNIQTPQIDLISPTLSKKMFTKNNTTKNTIINRSNHLPDVNDLIKSQQLKTQQTIANRRQLKQIHPIIIKNSSSKWSIVREKVKKFASNKEFQPILFINDLKNQVQQRKTNIKSIFLINDISYFQKDNMKGLKKNLNNNNKYSKFDKMDHFITSPDNTFVQIWVLFMLVINFIFLINQQFIICFYDYFKWDDQYLYMLILTTLEIISHFFIGFYKNGQLNTSSQQVANHYIRGLFSFDICIIVMLIIKILRLGFFQHIRFLVFVKIFSLMKVYKRFRSSIIIRGNKKHMFDLFQLIIWMVFFYHIVGSLFFGVGKFEIEYLKYDINKTWIKLMVNNPFIDIYYECYLWAVSLTGTNLQIQPLNLLERIFSISMMLTTVMMMAYIINTIGVVIANITAEQKEKQEDIDIINDYSKKNNITKELRNQIISYIDYQHKSKNRFNNDSIQIFDKLSQNIKENVLKEVNTKILAKIPLFDQFSENFKQKAIFLLQQKQYLPGDLIYEYQKQNDEKYLYFLNKGTCELYLPNHSIDQFKSLSFIQESSTFGTFEFITNQLQNESCKSVSYCSIYMLNRSKFLQLLKHYPDDYQKFAYIKDKLLFRPNQNLYRISNECQVCLSKDHFSKDCPNINCLDNKPQFLIQYAKLNNLSQYRKFFLRNLRKYHTISQVNLTRFFFEKIQEQNILLFDSSSEYETEEQEDEIQNLLTKRESKAYNKRDTNRISKRTSQSFVKKKNFQDSELEKSKNKLKEKFKNTFIFQDQYKQVQYYDDHHINIDQPFEYQHYYKNWNISSLKIFNQHKIRKYQNLKLTYKKKK